MALTIVHVLTRLLRAGSEENTLETCRSQSAAGNTVIIVHGREFDPQVRKEAEAVAQRVVTVESLVHPLSPANDPAAVRELASLFKSLKADVVHTHQSKAGIVGRVAARLAGVPGIVHGVHILPFVNVGKAQELIYVTAERLCAGFTHAFIDVSPSVRDACIARGIGSAKNHFVAHSAMQVDRFKNPNPPADWRELLHVPDPEPKPPTVVMLAAFEPRKRQLDFIRALPDAFAGLRDWRVLFAGQGETLEDARALTATLGLADKVRFAGFRKDPEAIVALADVCVLTSLREGLPRVVVQYAAAGKPMVVSRLPGIEDVVRDGVSAVITPGADVAAAARAAARLLGDAAEREQLVAGTRAIDVDAWSPARMNRSIDEAYGTIAGLTPLLFKRSN